MVVDSIGVNVAPRVGSRLDWGRPEEVPSAALGATLRGSRGLQNKRLTYLLVVFSAVCQALDIWVSEKEQNLIGAVARQ